MTPLSYRAVFAELSVTRVHSVLEGGTVRFPSREVSVWAMSVLAGRQAGARLDALDGSPVSVRAGALVLRRHQTAESMSTVLG
jgi:hypothetical protein